MPDQDLPYLYSQANVFVYPSLYEGFGMPPLEAMACGCPVIVSDNSSLPEVVGSAGILVNTENIQNLAKNISDLLSDRKKLSRARDRGIIQAQKFSWKDSAQKIIKLFETTIY